METQTTTIAEFLLARFAEDEVVAGEAFASYSDDALDAAAPLAGYLRHFEPARCLDTARHQASAVRTLSRLFQTTEHWLEAGFPGGEDSVPDEREDEYSCLCTASADAWEALQDLAAPYADHPDFREEWRVA